MLESNEPYNYSNLKSLNSSVNKLINKRHLWLKRFFLIQALYLYLAYTEAQTRIYQEYNEISLGSRDHTNHSDALYKTISSSIATYSFIVACFEIGKKLVGVRSRALKKRQSLINEITEKRNRLAAHPSEKIIISKRKRKKINLIAWKQSSISSSGEIWFRQINIDQGEPYDKEPQKLNLNPKQDFESLQQFVEEIANEVRRRWKL